MRWNYCFLWKRVLRYWKKWFPLARMKDLLKNKFTVDRKSFNEKWEKVGFHLPENPFPLARMKDSFPKYVSTRRAKTIPGRDV